MSVCVRIHVRTHTTKSLCTHSPKKCIFKPSVQKAELGLNMRPRVISSRQYSTRTLWFVLVLLAVYVTVASEVQHICALA